MTSVRHPSPPLDSPEAQALLRAVRGSSIVGKGSCHYIDECMTDAELIAFVLEITSGSLDPAVVLEALGAGPDALAAAEALQSCPIVVVRTTVDAMHEPTVRGFQTLEEARAWARQAVGDHPNVSLMFAYAVSQDGVSKVEARRGATLAQLFPDSPSARGE